ncbi:hypothetical protein [Croceicoccus bisphenolivorans]|uniref:hypothetical protein n=1 Tax=Croceicoccus bisphenolivorans TaxID=1783232 RepID=UPI00082F00F2|nr:hypothetical protein [Croceicoccus bisphenolivorans]
MTIVAPDPGGSTLQYSRVLAYGLFNGNFGGVENTTCVFGVPTEPDDEPSTSPVSYTAFASGGSIVRVFTDGTFASYTVTGSQEAISVDLNTYTVDITMHLTGTLGNKSASGSGASAETTVDFGTFTANDIEINDEPYSIGGLFNYQDFDLQMPFQGWFFGPKGKEIGIAVTYFRPNDPGYRAFGNITVTASR